jgi:hypothetical protein
MHKKVYPHPLLHLNTGTFLSIKESTDCYTKCGYEIPGMILLQAYPYTYSSLLRDATFTVLPLSSYARSPTMQPLPETFLELLLWNSF